MQIEQIMERIDLIGRREKLQVLPQKSTTSSTPIRRCRTNPLTMHMIHSKCEIVLHVVRLFKVFMMVNIACLEAMIRNPGRDMLIPFNNSFPRLIMLS